MLTKGKKYIARDVSDFINADYWEGNVLRSTISM